MLVKTILIILGAGLIVYSIVGINKGSIFMKGSTAVREGNSGKFWLYIAIYLAFGLMLLVFGIFGHIQK